jgi:hypothetical protein
MLETESFYLCGLIRNINPQKNQIYLKKARKMTNEQFKAGAETFQKTVNDSMKWFKEATQKAADEYSKHMDLSGSKEKMNALMDTFKKEVAQMEEFNKKIAESLSAQFKTASASTEELTGKLKKEFEKNMESAKASFHTFEETVKKQAAPATSAGMDLLNGLHKEVDQMVKQNMKLWSDFMNTATSGTTNTANTAGASDKKGTDKKEKSTI